MIRLSSPSIGDEECAAVEKILRSGQLVHGEECVLFEKELADYLGCPSVRVVSSGTAALHLALIALGIGKGDAVLVPSFTFPATVNVVELVGARPVFVDVDTDSYVVNSKNVEAAIENWQGKEKIRAIMVVHEFGYPANMTEIMQVAKKYDLKVVEDAACALGTQHKGKKAGTFGDIGCFSFHPRKAITTGEGGAVAIYDSDLADKIGVWRNHGIRRNDAAIDFVVPGFNYRMTNFQAALGRVQLKKFDAWLEQRNVLQKKYQNELEGTSMLLPKQMEGHAWQTYMIVLPIEVDRLEIIKQLHNDGVETNLGAQAIHCLAYYRDKYHYQDFDFPNAHRLFKNGLALPFCQSMAVKDVEIVCHRLKSLVK